MKTCGDRKQTFFVTPCDSPLFERAYFLFRRGAEDDSDEDGMVREAERLADDILRGKKRRRRSRGDASALRWFALGAVCSLVLLVLGAVVAVVIAFASGAVAFPY